MLLRACCSLLCAMRLLPGSWVYSRLFRVIPLCCLVVRERRVLPKLLWEDLMMMMMMMMITRWRGMLTVGSLQIRRSQESDEGKYECVAENSLGVAYSYGANLYVRGNCRHLRRPRITHKALFTNNGRNTKYHYGLWILDVLYILAHNRSRYPLASTVTFRHRLLAAATSEVGEFSTDTRRRAASLRQLYIAEDQANYCHICHRWPQTVPVIWN